MGKGEKAKDLSPLSPSPSHHSPLALYARSHHPSSREFPNPHLAFVWGEGGGRGQRYLKNKGSWSYLEITKLDA